MEEVRYALEGICNVLEDVRDTATLRATYLRLQKAKQRLMTLMLEMEEDMEANQQMVKQKQKNKLKALRLMADKFRKQIAEHVEIREEVLSLGAELGRFTGDRGNAKNRN